MQLPEARLAPIPAFLLADGATLVHIHLIPEEVDQQKSRFDLPLNLHVSLGKLYGDGMSGTSPRGGRGGRERMKEKRGEAGETKGDRRIFLHAGVIGLRNYRNIIDWKIPVDYIQDN